MAKVLALTAIRPEAGDLLRSAIVLGCSAVLAFAGQVLPIL
jgi:hypothetical protein